MAKKKSKKNKQNMTVILTVIVVCLLAIFLYMKATRGSMSMTSSSEQMMAYDFDNQKVKLNNEEIMFTNGSYASADNRHTTTILNSVNSSSGANSAAILVDNPGGSGSFYYLLGASKKAGKDVYSTPVMLGDRIKFQSMTVSDDHIITVQYLDRGPNDAMATEPTLAVKKMFAFQDNGNLIEDLH